MLWRSITSIRRLVKKVPHVEGTLFTLLALLLGFFVFYLGQKLDPIDALYLTIVTISTVGYGDISPSDACIDDEGNDISGSTACVGMRVFSVFYIMVGCGYVFAHLASVFGGALERFSNFVKRQIDKCSSTIDAVDTTGDGTCDTKVTGRSVGLSGRSHDITGDGVADFVEPPTLVVYWAQELLPAIFLVSIVQLLSALIFTVCIPELDFGTALYHCIITATTVGYGDVAMSTPEAKLFACLHIVVSVSWLASLIGWIDKLDRQREAQLARAELILNPPDLKAIMKLDHDKRGVDELEFVVGMLMNLGVELCGQKLTWDDVRPFKLQFRMFRGRKKSGRIAPQDLVSYSLKMQEAKRRMALVRDVVKTGRSEFVAGDRRSEFAASRSSYPVLSSSAEHPTRRRKPSFLARSLDERLHHAPHAPQRSLTGEAAHQDMEIAAAKMQALVRGRTSRKNSPMLLRRGVRVAPTA